MALGKGGLSVQLEVQGLQGSGSHESRTRYGNSSGMTYCVPLGQVVPGAEPQRRFLCERFVKDLLLKDW